MQPNRVLRWSSNSIRRRIAFSILRVGATESEAVRKLINDVSQANIFIDGGANIGKVSKLVLREISCQNLLVLAFEPDPLAFEELKFISDSRFQAHNRALFNAEGTFILYRHIGFKENSSTTSSTLNSTKSNVGTDDSVHVETICLSNFVQRNQPNEIVMKLDIEGSEYEVINNLLTTKEIDKFARIYCEFHPHKIRFGIMKHILLLAKLMLSGNLSRIRYWY